MRITLATRIIDPRKIIGNLRIKRSKAFSQIAPIAKQDIKTELRSPKSGIRKPKARIARYRASPARRSAAGESLARDTGRSEKLIAAQKNIDSLSIGFLESPDGDNYVSNWELDGDRPTIADSRTRSLEKINSIINRHFKI